MLHVYLLTLALAVGMGLAATLISLAASRTIRLADLFHQGRGITEQPRWGGAVIFLTFAIVPFIASAVSDRASALFSPKSSDFLSFLGACALVFAIGFLDDWKVLSWKPKLLGQVGAASAVYAAGYSIDKIGLPWGATFALGPFAPVMTVLWVVFFTNAINLVDGRDGVAPGVAILAAATMAQIAATSHHPTVALLLVTVAGALLGFLPFNLPRASAYLGDSGALLLGFIIGSLSIRAATGPAGAVFVGIPLIALGFATLDTLLAFTRRILDHRHPLVGDNDHIHHRLEVAGFGPRGLLTVIYVICIFFSAGAILLHYVHLLVWEGAVLAGTMLMVAVILMRLGYLLSLWNSASMIWVRQHVRGAGRDPEEQDLIPNN